MATNQTIRNQAMPIAQNRADALTILDTLFPRMGTPQYQSTDIYTPLLADEEERKRREAEEAAKREEEMRRARGVGTIDEWLARPPEFNRALQAEFGGVVQPPNQTGVELEHADYMRGYEHAIDDAVSSGAPIPKQPADLATFTRLKNNQTPTWADRELTGSLLREGEIPWGFDAANLKQPSALEQVGSALDIGQSGLMRPITDLLAALGVGRGFEGYERQRLDQLDQNLSAKKTAQALQERRKAEGYDHSQALRDVWANRLTPEERQILGEEEKPTSTSVIETAASMPQFAAALVGDAVPTVVAQRIAEFAPEAVQPALQEFADYIKLQDENSVLDDFLVQSLVALPATIGAAQALKIPGIAIRGAKNLGQAAIAYKRLSPDGYKRWAQSLKGSKELQKRMEFLTQNPATPGRAVRAYGEDLAAGTGVEVAATGLGRGNTENLGKQAVNSIVEELGLGGIGATAARVPGLIGDLNRGAGTVEAADWEAALGGEQGELGNIDLSPRAQAPDGLRRAPNPATDRVGTGILPQLDQLTSRPDVAQIIATAAQRRRDPSTAQQKFVVGNQSEATNGRPVRGYYLPNERTAYITADGDAPNTMLHESIHELIANDPEVRALATRRAGGNLTEALEEDFVEHYVERMESQQPANLKQAIMADLENQDITLTPTNERGTPGTQPRNQFQSAENANPPELPSIEQARQTQPKEITTRLGKTWDMATNGKGNPKAFLTIGAPSENLKSKIRNALGDQSINPTTQKIRIKQVQHINERHGIGNEKDPTQIPVTKETFELIPDVLGDPTSVTAGNSNVNPSVQISKAYSDGRIVVADALMENGELRITTMWVKKPKVGKTAKADSRLSAPTEGTSQNSEQPTAPTNIQNPGQPQQRFSYMSIPFERRRELEKKYRENGTWLKAPNGKDTKLENHQWLEVRTPEFKKWFGDWENNPKNASKVIDENGEPLVVYHGPRNIGDFTVFNGQAQFFTDSFETAEVFQDEYAYIVTINGKPHAVNASYARDIVAGIDMYDELENWLDFDIVEMVSSEYPKRKKDFLKNFKSVMQDSAKGPIKSVTISKNTNDIMAVYLNIRNPKIIDYKGKTWGETGAYIENDFDAENNDGFIAKNLREGGLAAETLLGEDMPIQTTYTTFSPTQIKSATDNRGTFDESNPDIRYSLARPYENLGRQQIAEHPLEVAAKAFKKYAWDHGAARGGDIASMSANLSNKIDKNTQRRAEGKATQDTQDPREWAEEWISENGGEGITDPQDFLDTLDAWDRMSESEKLTQISTDGRGQYATPTETAINGGEDLANIPLESIHEVAKKIKNRTDGYGATWEVEVNGSPVRVRKNQKDNVWEVWDETDQSIKEIQPGEKAKIWFDPTPEDLEEFNRRGLGGPLTERERLYKQEAEAAHHNENHAKQERDSAEWQKSELERQRKVLESTPTERMERFLQTGDIKLDGNAYQGKYDPANRDSVEEWFQKIRPQTIKNTDTGFDVTFNGRALKKLINRMESKTDYARTFAELPKIIRDMKLIAEEPNAKGTGKFDSFGYYMTGIEMDGKPQTILSTVGIKDKNIYYDQALLPHAKGDLMASAAKIKGLDAARDQLIEAGLNSDLDLSDSKYSRFLKLVEESFGPNAQILRAKTLKEDAERVLGQGAMGKERKRKAEVEEHRNTVGFNEDANALANRGRQTKEFQAQKKMSERFKDQAASVRDRALRYFVDKYTDIARLGRALKNDAVYDALDLSQGRKTYLGEEFSTKFERPIGKLLVQNRIKPADFGDYLYARHALDANRVSKQDGASGMTDEEARETIKKAVDTGKIKIYEEAAEKVQEMNRWKLAQMRKNGVITKETEDRMNRLYPNYVPLGNLDPQTTEMIEGNPETGAALGINTLKRRNMRDTKAENVLGQAMANAATAVMNAENNSVFQALYDMAKANPDPDLWEIDATTVRDGKVDEADTYENNVITGYIDGEPHRVKLNKYSPMMVRIANSLKGMSDEKVNKAIKWVGDNITKRSGRLFTTYSPEFPFSNFSRDFLQNLVFEFAYNGVSGVFSHSKNILPAMRAVYQKGAADRGGKAGATKMDKYYEEYRKIGGKIGFQDVGTAADYLETYEKQMEIVGKKRSAPINGFKAFVGFVEGANSIIEQANRVSMYATLRENGDTPAQAARKVRDVTNFNRAGEGTPTMGALYMFFNAAVQGTKGYIDLMNSQDPAVRRRARGAVAALVGAGMANTILNLALDGEDDNGIQTYQNIPEWQKINNMILALPGKPFATIPMPYGLNTAYNLGRRLAEQAWATREESDQSPDWGEPVAGLMSDIMETMNPLGGERKLGAKEIANMFAPSAIDPLVDMVANRDFTGRQIVPESKYSPKPAHSSYRADANQLWVQLTDLAARSTGGTDVKPGTIDISPETIEFVLNSYLGTTGRVAQQALHNMVVTATKVLGSDATAQERQTQVDAKAYLGDYFTTRQMPVLRRLLTANMPDQSRWKVYDIMSAVDLDLRDLDSWKEILKEDVYRKEKTRKEADAENADKNLEYVRAKSIRNRFEIYQKRNRREQKAKVRGLQENYNQKAAANLNFVNKIIRAWERTEKLQKTLENEKDSKKRKEISEKIRKVIEHEFKGEPQEEISESVD